MGLVLVLSLCWVVAGIRLGTISPLEIHATLHSSRIIALFGGLNFDKSINEMSTLLQARRLGLFREYNLAVRRNSELLEEIAEAVSMEPDLQQDHRSRNCLFNYHLTDLMEEKTKFKNVGLSYESMKGVLKPTVMELMYMDSEEELVQMSKATYLALDYLHFVLATFETTSQYDIIIEALIRIRFILSHLIDDLPVALEKNTRQLRYLQWNMGSVLEKRPTVPLRKIRAYLCRMFKDFEMEEGFCEDQKDIEEMFKEVELGIWEIEEPGRLKSFAYIKKYQKELTRKCNVQLLHMLTSPASITLKMAEKVLEACANGLMSEDTYTAMIVLLTTQGRLGLSYTLIEALLPNVLDAVLVHRKLSHFIHFSSDHKAVEMAVQSIIMAKRGFLTTFPDIEASMPERRTLIMDRLNFHVNRVFDEPGLKGGLLKLISEYALIVLRLRVSLKGWWRRICFDRRGLTTVRPLHLVMTMIMGPISELAGLGFTVRDIYGVLLDYPTSRCKKRSSL